MKKIRTVRDLDHRLEVVEIQRGIEWSKVKAGLQSTKSSLVPTAFSLSYSAVRGLLKRRKKKKKK